MNKNFKTACFLTGLALVMITAAMVFFASCGGGGGGGVIPLIISRNTQTYATDVLGTFGTNTNGVVVTAVGPSSDRAYALAVQLDGKIVAAGSWNNGTNPDPALVRYNSDGTLDSTFGGDGIVATNSSTNEDRLTALGIQSDVKIVAAGYTINAVTGYDFLVTRYTTTGSLDSTFGSFGIVKTDIGISDDRAFALAIQPDGKIVVAGSTNTVTGYHLAVARYNKNGTLDNTFDTDGIVVTDVGAGTGFISALAIQSNGRIVVAGYSNNGTNDTFAAARYNSNGAMDNTFGTHGGVATDVGSISAIAVQSDAMSQIQKL